MVQSQTTRTGLPSSVLADDRQRGVVLSYFAGRQRSARGVVRELDDVTGEVMRAGVKPARPTPAESAPGLQAGPALLSAVAHDLRTPITALTMSAELLAEEADALGPGQIRGMASSLRRQALGLQELVENLLCATVLDEGRFEVHPRPTMLADLLEEVGQLVEPLLAHKGQRLRLSTALVPHEVAADSRRISQVLVNLISNASKHAGRDSVIDVTCVVRGEAVRVMVSDRGPGLPAGSAGRLFEPFCGGAEDARSGKEGVGLGLAIVKAIVEAHGGQVGAENRRGGGASFWFELPLAVGGPSPRGGPSRIGRLK